MRKTVKMILMSASSIVALVPLDAALAQAAVDPAPAVDGDREGIVVTGTRLPRRDFTSTSPILTVRAEEIKASAPGTPEVFLYTLPQVVADIGASSSDSRGGNGGSQINLRGLGAQRNLVLINGRRALGSNATGIVDISNIPVALIERVEVITGGASAVYGADAVAGVTNFILNENIRGLRIDADQGITEREDVPETNISVTWGGKFADDRGSATLSYTYYKRGDIFMYDRSFSRESEFAGATQYGAFNPVGNLPTQAAIDSVFGAYGFAPGSVDRADQLGVNNDRTLFSTSVSATAPPVVNFRGPLDKTIATAFLPGRLAFQYSPQTSLITPLERHSIFGTAKYDITENITAFAQVLYSQYDSTTFQGWSNGAGPAVGGTFIVPITNPFIPADLRTLLASRPTPTASFRYQRRIPELGLRIETYDNDIFQVVAGLRGKLSDDWRFEVYGSRGVSHDIVLRKGGGSFAAITALLNAPDGGASVCEGGFNIFGAVPVSAQCVQRINPDSLTYSKYSSDIVEGSISGSPFALPAGSLDVSVGIQHRRDDFVYVPDNLIRTGDYGGFNIAPPVAGGYRNTDYFAEMRVPILKDIPLIQELEVTGGYRHSEHSIVGGFDTYKIDGLWQVVDMLKLRGSYQRAVRAPHIGDLFAPAGSANIIVTDPCNINSAQRTNASTAAAVRALCLAQGVPAGSIDLFNQPTVAIIADTGGNINLREETATTYTFGAVVSSPFKTGFLSRLTLSVDYYDIEITDAISSLQAASFIPRCFNSAGDNPSFAASNQFCQLFSRRADGGIVGANQRSINIGRLRVSGIDGQLDWRAPIGGLGTLGITAAVSWLERFDRQDTPQDRTFDFAGTIGSFIGSAIPKWKGSLTAGLTSDRFSLSARARYIGAMSNRVNVTAPGTGTNVPATWYVDTNIAVPIDDRFTLRASIINLFDQQPRLYTPQQQARTDPSTYDVLGRRYLIGIGLKL